MWPPQHRYGNSNLVPFGMNTTTRQTRIPKLFLTAKTVNPSPCLLHVPNESIADKHETNIQIFCRKLRFRCQDFVHYFRRSRSGQVHSFMAAPTCLRCVETNLKLTCPSPKSFVCNLPDSGRHVTSVFQGLSLSRSEGRVGENSGNEVAIVCGSLASGILLQEIKSAVFGIIE